MSLSRFTARVTVLPALLLAVRAHAQGPNPALLALPDGAWSELPDSAMVAAGSMQIPCCTWGLGCDLPGILAYSGATLDTHNGRIVVWGGGHNDYFGNQLLVFDLATLEWRLETAPTSLCLFSSPPDYRFSNGDPVSRHTYDHIGILAPGVFFAYSGASADAPPYNNGDSYGDLWTYDFASRAWTDRTALQSGDIDYWLPAPGASGEVDPVSGDWFQLSAQGVWRLDLATHAWTKVNESGHPGIERVTVYDPVRRLLWTYGGDYGGDAILSAYDIDANELRIVSSDGLPGATSGAGLAYDAANDDLVVYGGSSSGSVFNYDIAGDVWTEHAASGPGPSGKVYGRFLYDPLHNLFLLIASVDSVWVWKNTLGNGVPLFADGFESGDLSRWSAGAAP